MTKKQRKKKKKLQMKNKRLIKKYYWLMPRNVWSGEILKDYDYTWIDWGWSEGWDRAFGWMYLKELGDEINRIGQKDFMIVQLKEKFGEARCYTSGTSHRAHEIINKYETLSRNICYFCGRPDTHVTDMGWILPVCPKCYEKKWRRGSRFEYDEIVCDDDSRMSEKYKNIANKIRILWNKKHPDDRVELYIKESEEVTDGS